MGSNSDIEWCDASWTPIRARNLKTGKVGWHCEHATTGCEFCYAESMNKRLGTGLPFKPGHRKDVEIFLDEKMLREPLRWKRPRRIFVCSMTDLFADFVTDEMLDRIFAVMALCPQHTFQCLTKRAERMRDYVHAAHERIASTAMEEAPVGRDLKAAGLIFAPREKPSTFFERWPLTNVWLGVSAERQPEWDERTAHLRFTPAAVRFVSVEPMLGAIVDCDLDQIDWIICGGESGRNARPMHPDWARSLRDQCQAAGVAFFFKQWGEWAPGECASRPQTRTERVAEFFNDGWNFGSLTPKVSLETHTDDAPDVWRFGKKAAGRILDGQEHNAFPQQTETAHVDPD